MEKQQALIIQEQEGHWCLVTNNRHIPCSPTELVLTLHIYKNLFNLADLSDEC